MVECRAAHITAAATAVLNPDPGYLGRVVVGTELTAGTLKLHDCATTGAVAAGNMIASIKLDTRGTYEFDVFTGTGLTYVLSGTADVTVAHG